MKRKIVSELCQLEAEKGIHIVNARERGSRMLGASHDESDWDVLFLFNQEPSAYATLSGRIDSIHEPHLGEDGLIDLHGWNVDKFGELLSDSNPNAIEYCRPNPKEYMRFHDGGQFEEMATDARENANLMALYHHYISMAKSNYCKYIESGNDCTKGRQFYVARSIAAAQYIRRKNSIGPLNAMALAGSGALDDELAGVLKKLTEAKRAGQGNNENNDIVGPLYEEESDAEMEPTDARIKSPDRELIDEFIRTAVQ